MQRKLFEEFYVHLALPTHQHLQFALCEESEELDGDYGCESLAESLQLLCRFREPSVLRKVDIRVEIFSKSSGMRLPPGTSGTTDPSLKETSKKRT